MANLYGNFSAKTVVETKVDIVQGTWTALPTTALAGRQLVEVYIKAPTQRKVYFSFDNAETLKNRAAIGGGEFRIFPIQDNLTLYAQSHGGSARLIVTEYR